MNRIAWAKQGQVNIDLVGRTILMLVFGILEKDEQ